MGVCASSDSLSNEIDAMNAKAFREEQKISKILLLGAGESGKSTIFKQLTTIYGEGIGDKSSYVQVIHGNIITGMKALVFGSKDNGGEEYAIGGGLEDAVAACEESMEDTEMTPELIAFIKRLWADPGIKKTVDLKAKYQLLDCATYFLDKIDEVTAEGFMPSFEDVLHARARTVGIAESEFEMSGQKFRIFDVGGQRNERKKWIHCFEGVTAVIFVASLSGYDQMLFEDESVKRIHESMDLFEKVCNSHWFKDTSIILFLNKRDLFQEKIPKIPFTVCFPEYTGDAHAYDECCAYLREKFESRLLPVSKNPDESKQLYTHMTCATDTENMKFVFSSVRDIIIRSALVEGGLYLDLNDD
eukprot:954053_1